MCMYVYIHIYDIYLLVQSYVRINVVKLQVYFEETKL